MTPGVDMIRPESLEFPPLNCSLGRPLGDYYQDLREAIRLVEAGYHGPPPEDGLPRADGEHGNPILTSQYTLANLAAAARGDHGRRERSRKLLDSLVADQEATGEWEGCWMIRYDNPKYPWLKAPWTSALAAGNAISALLRGWELFGVQAYRAAAEKGYTALHEPRAGALYRESADELWYEEYPADPPVGVLNGHVYCLLGVLDYARATSDAEAESRWRLAASTAIVRLDDFDLGYWSAYDLRWREPATIHYHKNIHIPLLYILAALTGEEAPRRVAQRWEGYLQSAISRLRRSVNSRLHRWQARPPWAR